MTWVDKNHTSREQAANGATGQDLSKAFVDDLNRLYQLSFLLTRDHEKAQRCLVSGFEDCSKGNPAFSEWVRSWQKRLIIENAIRELQPQPTRSHSPSPAAVFPFIDGLSSSRSGHFTLEAILALEDFERFVFVMSVLEHYSERDCALVLGCSVSSIRKARTRALAQLSNQQAVARRYAMLTEQAQAISYIEVYWFLAGVSLLMFFLSFLLANNEPSAEAKCQCIERGCHVEETQFEVEPRRDDRRGYIRRNSLP